jgi:TrmH RNA methyltransferase
MRKPSRPGPRPPAGRPPAKGEKLLRVAGLNAVAALFVADSGRVERLFFEERLKPDLAECCRLLAAARKPYRMVGAEELQRVAGTEHHGGVVAVARSRAVADFDPEAAKAWAAAGEPLLLLDGIGNPHNLGAIARTGAFFGLRRLVLADHPAQAAPSDAAYRVAEGGLDRLALYRAVRFATALRRLKPHYRVIGAALGRGQGPRMLAGGKPVALVLGNEETGLGAATLAACDAVVTIEGAGGVQSLNVSAAAAILIYELAAKRG